MTYTLGSLFSGIGGIDLAFTWAGFDVAWQVEIDDYATKVLQRHWPDVPKYRDVRGITGRSGKGWRGYQPVSRVDVLAGGFPCTDISLAGKGAGITEGTRSGLWFEFRRLIGELRPRIVFLENVAAITSRDGTVVIADLAEMGYSASWGIISAADTGAPHLRQRWFCVAYADLTERETCSTYRMGERKQADSFACDGAVAYAASERLPQRGCPGQSTRKAQARAGLDTKPERCGEMAYADSARRYQGGLPIGEEPKYTITGDAGEMGNTNGAGLLSTRSGRKTAGANGRTQSAVDGTGGRVAQSRMGRVFARLPYRMDGGRLNAKKTKRNTNETMQELRKIIGEKEIQQQTGRLWCIYASSILQPAMFKRIQQKRKSNSRRIPQEGVSSQGKTVRRMWNNQESKYSSYRRGRNERNPIKLDDIMCVMSHEMALEEWEDYIETTIGMQNLWDACKETGYVPETLSALQKIWRSMPYKNQAGIILRANKGRRLIWAGFPAPPGPQYDWEPPRTVEPGSVANRPARLKALGNSVIPQVVYPLAVEIRQMLEEIDRPANDL